MKIINNKKATAPKFVVGDVVRLNFDHFDGRVHTTANKKAVVVKVNRVTLDAKTNEGKIYRVKLNEVALVGA